MNETLLVLEMMDAIHHQIQSLISRKIIESPYEPDYSGSINSDHKSQVVKI